MTKKSEGGPAHPPLKPATRLATSGRDAGANHGFVNPPVHHASTVLYPTAEDFLARRARYLYGRRGTPTSEALENALRALEGPACAGVALLPSGLAAISTALLAVLNAGDHLLAAHDDYMYFRPGYRKEMSIAAYENATGVQYRWESIAQRWTDLFDDLLSEE